MILFLTDRRHVEAVERLFLGAATALGAKRCMLGVAHVLGSLLAIFGATYVTAARRVADHAATAVRWRIVIAAAISSGGGSAHLARHAQATRAS